MENKDKLKLIKMVSREVFKNIPMRTKVKPSKKLYSRKAKYKTSSEPDRDLYLSQVLF